MATPFLLLMEPVALESLLSLLSVGTHVQLVSRSHQTFLPKSPMIQSPLTNIWIQVTCVALLDDCNGFFLPPSLSLTLL